MNKLLISIIIFAVIMLGYWVYQDSEMKKKKEVNQLMQDAHQSFNIVDAHLHNLILNNDSEAVSVHSSAHFPAKSS